MTIKHPEDALTVFRTGGREAVVVFTGGTRTGYKPVRHDGQIRVAYLAADGSEAPMSETEYGWVNPRTLRRVRTLA